MNQSLRPFRKSKRLGAVISLVGVAQTIIGEPVFPPYPVSPMFHAHKFALASLLLCVFAKGLSAGLILQGNDSAHIALGNQGTNASVGWLEVNTPTLGTVWGGSATLINGIGGAEGWALGAKHTVMSNQNDPSTVYSNIRIGFGNYLTNQTESRFASSIFLHPTKDLVLFKFDVAFNSV